MKPEELINTHFREKNGEWKLTGNATEVVQELRKLEEQAETTGAEQLRLHRARPDAFIPEDIGVQLPLPVCPERVAQIKSRLQACILIPLATGETGWQVYQQETVSSKAIPALKREAFIAK